MPINSKVKIHYNLANKSGLFVTKIEKDSPASRSQLEEGDIIVSFNNKWVNDSHELFKELSKKEIVNLINITVIRHAALLNFTIAPETAVAR